MNEKLKSQFERAKDASCPLISCESPDVWGFLSSVRSLDAMPEVWAWDSVRGIQRIKPQPLSPTSDAQLIQALRETTANIVGALDWALASLPREATLVMVNCGRLVDDPIVGSALSNLREPFKATRRMLILVSGSIPLPAEVAPDVLSFREPFPGESELAETLSETIAQANQALEAEGMEPVKLSEAETQSAVSAGKGLSAFGAEQVYSVSIMPGLFDLDGAWERKTLAINASNPGLRFSRPRSPRFADVAGLSAIKSDIKDLADGLMPFRVVVFVDEIEKSLEGSQGGDLSGVSSDFLGVMLTELQEHDALGMRFQGWNGCGKSLIAEATAAEFGCPLVKWDTNKMKSSYQGQSGQNIRAAFKTLWSLAPDGQVLFLVTCNREVALPPELISRFRQGSYWVDAPSIAQAESLWALYLGKYSISGESPADLARAYPGWNGREIKAVCDRVWRAAGKRTIAYYARRSVPTSVSRASELKAMRLSASGKLTDAETGEPYTYNPDDLSSILPGKRSFA